MNQSIYRILWFFPIVLFLFCQGCDNKIENISSVEIKEVWIPMPDGIQLAADLYIPRGRATNSRYPILLEYLPYRKDEHRKLRYPVFSYFVDRGYIVARVDIRGTGRSQGKLIEYEYTDQEQDDGEVVIDWLSRQSFSSGSVGMFGISWGGFNAIHLAMRNPPALKAILAMMATDDIYQDDVHFMDGMMHVDAYEIGRDLKNVIPAAPDYRVDKEYFENRFDTEPWLLKYKRMQRDGSFWDRASLNRDYSLLQIPIYLISGWYDGYRDSTPRILEFVKASKKALVGPWNHTFPHMADPPPQVEWREEAVRWFDFWLKGIDNGISEDPEMAVFIREGHGPGVPDSIPGTWQWVDKWPPANGTTRTLFLKDRSLQTAPPAESYLLNLKYRPSSGIEASGSVMWWGDWSPDLRNGDRHSLIFETEPLDRDVIILGLPKVRFNASVSASQSHFIARLCDVGPDSSVTMVTGAGLNGAHRYSATNPTPLQPGKFYPLEIEMHFTSWTFKKGHRIRLSLSNGQWPMIWPNPSPLDMNIRIGGPHPSLLELPLIPLDSASVIPVFKKPLTDPKLPGYETSRLGTVSGFAEISETSYDPEKGITEVIASNSGETLYPWARWSSTEKIVHKVLDSDPAHAAIESKYNIQIQTADRTLLWIGTLTFTSDSENFYYTYSRQLLEGEELLREKKWQEIISRDFQ